MSLYIVRHGETDWNAQHKVMGKVDIELNENGILQALGARDKLPHEHLDIVISSPLKRAVQTAEIICQALNIEIIVDDRISERDFGEFEGMNKRDFDFIGYWSYKKNNSYEKAENIRNFFIRIYGFLDEITSKYSDKNVLIVAHGGVSIPMYCYFNSIPEDDNLLSVVLDNCGIKRLI